MISMTSTSAGHVLYINGNGTVFNMTGLASYTIVIVMDYIQPEPFVQTKNLHDLLKELHTSIIIITDNIHSPV